MPRSIMRALSLAVALVFLLVSLSAEAKKKKAAKKHKTPAASSSKSKSKSTSDRGLPPPDESGSDEAGSDEKSSSKKAAPEADESEEKKPPPLPEPEEDKPVKKPPPKVVKAPKDEEGAGGALVALQFGLGGKALFRKLAWTEDGGMLAPYTLSPGPELAAWLEAYPAAFATDGFAANIGLFGSFNYGIGASSKTPAGATLTTKYQDWLAGIKIRFPVGIVIPYIAGAYGSQKFHLDPAAMDRPNFNYTMAHLGGGARFQFTPAVDLDVGAGYLLVPGLGKAAGEVASPALYPDATAYGFEAALSVGFRLASMIGIRVGADFRQIGVALHWKMAQTGIKAGGAVDRYIGAWGGLELVFDGISGGESEPAPAKAPAKAKKPPKEAEPEEGEGEKGDKGEKGEKGEKEPAVKTDADE